MTSPTEKTDAHPLIFMTTFVAQARWKKGEKTRVRHIRPEVALTSDHAMNGIIASTRQLRKSAASSAKHVTRGNLVKRRSCTWSLLAKLTSRCPTPAYVYHTCAYARFSDVKYFSSNPILWKMIITLCGGKLFLYWIRHWSNVGLCVGSCA